MRRKLVVGVMCAGFITAPPAWAGGNESRDRKALGGNAHRQADGLYRVDLPDGSWFTSHGADPAAPDHGVTLGREDGERAPVCATDYYQHVLYGRPASAPDRSADVKQEIVSAVGRMNAVLNEEALLSGGVTADYKVLCERKTTTMRVDAFVNTASNSGADIVMAARRAGFHSSKADYTIFYDGPPAAKGVCGLGSFAADDRLVARNANNTGGDYGITYASCWNGTTPMHENGHNQGAVQAGAPNSTGTGAHCIDDLDVMCYTPDGGDRNQLVTFLWCTDAIHYDCRNDDYFDAAPEPGEWLATHWNIGSRLNRFVMFGG